MIDPEAEFQELKGLHSSAQDVREGGKLLALLPDFQFWTEEGVQTMDLLLYPYEHSGYYTRLFFKQPLSKGQNWGQHVVAQETWWSPSRQGVVANQSWLAILAAHLRAVS